VGSLALGTGLALAAPLAASADEPKAASFADGTFLSGQVLGIDLDDIVALEGARAENDGSQGTQLERNPLKATVLDSVTLASQPINVGGLGSLIQLGAVTQYAEANSDGSSTGASGAVTDQGAIAAGGASSAPIGTTTIDLSGLIGQDLAGTLANLKLQLVAIAARADGSLDSTTGDYTLAGAKLQFTSPAIGQLTSKVSSSLATVNQTLAGLEDANGPLGGLVRQLVSTANPALALAGTQIDLGLDISTGDLLAAVSSILEESYGDSGISFDLETGAVTVDLAKYVGGLNDLPPGTELLSDAVVTKLLTSVTDTVSTLADQVVAKVRALLDQATVSVHAAAVSDVAQSPLVTQVCETVPTIVDVPVDVVNGVTGGLGDLTGGLGGLLGGVVGGVGDVVGGVTGTVQQVVNQVVCHDVTQAVAPLRTSLALDLSATVKQLLSGAAANARATLTLPAGVTVDVPLSATIDGIGDVLSGALGQDGAIGALIRALDANLVSPAVTGLLGSGSSVEHILTDLLSVKVNLQETSVVGGGFGTARTATAGTRFTETAVRVSVLPALGGAATINLAQATVGPNASAPGGDDGDNDGDDDGDGDNNGGGDNGGGDNGGSGGTVTAHGANLAVSGIGIAVLVALFLALVAAGAYLVREGYRRRKGDLIA